MRKLRWGLLAAGNIARTFARAVRHSERGELRAIGSRELAKAEAFAREFSLPKAYGNYEQLLADPEVDAVYISTPHPQHAEWIIQAAEAGKHILCEKPLALNHGQALAAVKAARSHGVLLMEAFMYRCHPYIPELIGLIRRGKIGEIRLVRAVFSFNTPYDPASRLFNKALGGGGILDVGCYTASMARLIAGAASGVPFANPVEVGGAATLVDTGVDGWAAAVFKFSNGVIAQVSCGTQADQDSLVEITGSTGRILVPNCWVPAIEGGGIDLHVWRKGEAEEKVTVASPGWLYAHEADAFARAAGAGLLSAPEMPVEDSLDNMKTLDRWRHSVGVIYDPECPQPNL